MSDIPPPPSGSDPNQPPNPYQPTQPYSQPYQQPYQQQPPYGGPQYGAAAQDHPQSTTVLVLGILGLVVCGLIAPFAWVMGNRVVREIDASNGTIGGRGNANAGRICGIIGTCLVGLGLVFLVFVVIVAAAGSTSP